MPLDDVANLSFKQADDILFDMYHQLQHDEAMEKDFSHKHPIQMKYMLCLTEDEYEAAENMPRSQLFSSSPIKVMRYFKTKKLMDSNTTNE